MCLQITPSVSFDSYDLKNKLPLLAKGDDGLFYRPNTTWCANYMQDLQDFKTVRKCLYKPDNTPKRKSLLCVPAQSQEYRGEKTWHKKSWTGPSKSINPTAGQVSVRFLRGGTGDALPERYNYLQHATCACFWTAFWKQTLWGPTVPQWDLCSYSWIGVHHRTPEVAGLPLVPCSLHSFAFIQFYLCSINTQQQSTQSTL